MKKALIGLSTLVVLNLSSVAFAWSLQGDSFCAQYNDPKATLTELIDKGIKDVDHDAQLTVAQMYEHGCGADKDLPEAYAWYKVCANVKPEAAKQATALFQSFDDHQKQSAGYDEMTLSMKLAHRETNQESKQYLEDTHSDSASQHPAAVIQQFNQSYQTVQDE